MDMSDLPSPGIGPDADTAIRAIGSDAGAAAETTDQPHSRSAAVSCPPGEMTHAL